MAGTLTIDTLKASSGVLATQNGMTGIAKAWVNFSSPSSSPTIIGSFNVSSITYVSTGVWTVNMTTALPNANYAVVGGAGGTANTNGDRTVSVYPTSTTQFNLVTGIAGTATVFNSQIVCAAVFGS